MTSAEQTEAIKKSMQDEKMDNDYLLIAMRAIAEYPITDASNLDALNMRFIAQVALGKVGKA